MVTKKNNTNKKNTKKINDIDIKKIIHDIDNILSSNEEKEIIKTIFTDFIKIHINDLYNIIIKYIPFYSKKEYFLFIKQTIIDISLYKLRIPKIVQNESILKQKIILHWFFTLIRLYTEVFTINMNVDAFLQDILKYFNTDISNITDNINAPKTKKFAEKFLKNFNPDKKDIN